MNEEEQESGSIVNNSRRLSQPKRMVSEGDLGLGLKHRNHESEEIQENDGRQTPEKDEKELEEDMMSQSQIEDDSDLIYEKEVKVLIKDHKQIANFLMSFGIVVMALQTAFAFWCLYTIFQHIEKQGEGLLIIWYHVLKIMLNLKMSSDFVSTMKAR